MKVEWSPLALQRVEDIVDYIAQDNPEAALRWANELFESVGRLSEFPESGRIVPEIGLSYIRELLLGAYRVVYKVGTSIRILTVRHGKQLLQTEELDGER